MKHITVSKMIKAIEKNGLPQAHFQMFARGVDGEIVAACALGQGLRNLGLDNSDSNWDLSSSSTGSHFRSEVMYLNDTCKETIPVIVEILKEKFKNNGRAVVYDIYEEGDTRARD